MIRLEVLRDGFSIAVGETRFIRHERRSPCIELSPESPVFWREASGGRGKWIRRRLQRRTALRDFRIIESGPDRVRIKFAGLLELELELEGEIVRLSLAAREGNPSLRLRIAAVPGESIYGGGSPAPARIDLKGSIVELWSGRAEEGRGLPPFRRAPAGRSWPIPAFVSSSNYWLSVEGDSWMAFDFRGKDSTILSFGSLPRGIAFGKSSSTEGALGRLGRLAGRTPLPPSWTRRGALIGLSEKAPAVKKRLDDLAASAIAVSGLRFDALRLLDPVRGDEELLAALSYLGLPLLATLDPELRENAEAWREAEAEGNFLRRAAASESEDAGKTALLDPANPRARNRVKERLRAAMEAGIRGVVLGPGSALPGDASPPAGMGADGLRNNWSLMWAALAREAADESPFPGDILVLSSWGWAGGNARFSATFPVFAGQGRDALPGIASALAHGFSGGGFSWMSPSGRLPRPEIHEVLRAVELCTFGPLLEVPCDEELLEERAAHALLSRMSGIFVALAPYHDRVAEDFIGSFLPPLRHPALHYEGEAALHARTNQFMYGRDLLIAAGTAKGGGHGADLVDLDLPDDDWVHLWSSRRFGGGPVCVEAPPGCPAVFFRASSGFAGLFDTIRRSARRI